MIYVSIPSSDGKINFMIGLSYGKYGGGWREITRKQVYTLISITSYHLIILIVINLTFYITNYQKLRETCPNTELFLVRLSLISIRIQSQYWKIRTRNNSVFRHFSRSENYSRFACLCSVVLFSFHRFLFLLFIDSVSYLWQAIIS